MYAIVDIAGQQVKVEKGQKILVHRLEEEKGSKVDFDKVLLITNGDQTAVGNPVIEGAQVQATILDHLKGDKVFVFKKKRRKGYKKFNGHRQYLSLLEIEEIIEKGAKPKKDTKKAEKKETEVKAKKETTVKAKKETAVKAKKETETEAKKEPAKKTPKAATKTKEAPAKKTVKDKPKAEKPSAKSAEAKVKDTEDKAQPKKSTRKKKTEEPEDTSEN